MELSEHLATVFELYQKDVIKAIEEFYQKKNSDTSTNVSPKDLTFSGTKKEDWEYFLEYCSMHKMLDPLPQWEEFSAVYDKIEKRKKKKGEGFLFESDERTKAIEKIEAMREKHKKLVNEETEKFEENEKELDWEYFSTHCAEMDDIMEPFPTKEEFETVLSKLKKGKKTAFDNDTICEILNGIEKLREKEEKNDEPLKLIKYSEKSFALIGEGTRDIKDEIMGVGGKWNKGLKMKGKAVGGWIFSLKKTRAVLSMLNEKKVKYEVKGFGKIQPQLRGDGRYWCNETFFVIERKDDSEGKVVGVASDLEGKVKKLEEIDRFFCDTLGLEY